MRLSRSKRADWFPLMSERHLHFSQQSQYAVGDVRFSLRRENSVTRTHTLTRTPSSTHAYLLSCTPTRDACTSHTAETCVKQYEVVSKDSETQHDEISTARKHFTRDSMRGYPILLSDVSLNMSNISTIFDTFPSNWLSKLTDLTVQG